MGRLTTFRSTASVTFARGESKELAVRVRLLGVPFPHYRLGWSQAYALELVLMEHELEEWLPKLLGAPITKIECASSALWEHVTVVGAIVAPDRRQAVVAVDALVVLAHRSA